MRHGEKEIRFEQTEPFALYPGEILIGAMTPLTVVEANKALLLRANQDFIDRATDPSKATERVAGEEWLFEGPRTYFPQVQVDVIETISARIIGPNEALKVSAKRDFIDKNKQKRIAGEKWLIRQEGAYLPHISENIIELVKAVVLTEKKALHLKAIQSFVDVFGKERKAGDEWLVTIKDKETHIPDVYEKVVGEVNLITLSNRQYCIKSNPVDESMEQPGFLFLFC